MKIAYLKEMIADVPDDVEVFLHIGPLTEAKAKSGPATGVVVGIDKVENKKMVYIVSV
jgi:hypothetical protein